MPPASSKFGKGKKGEPGPTIINPGKVIVMPKSNNPSIEAAHPTSLPSFLVASSLFLLASHSKCEIVHQNNSKNNKKLALTTMDASNTSNPPPSTDRTNKPGTPNTKKQRASSPQTNKTTATGNKGSSSSKKGQNANDGDLDVNNAFGGGSDQQQQTSQNQNQGWNLEVVKRSIFLCDTLIGDLDPSRKQQNQNDNNNNNDNHELSGLSHHQLNTSHHTNNADTSNNNNNNEEEIDFDKLSSFFAASSGNHGLVVVRDENDRQRIFAGGMNDEGQLPLPINIKTADKNKSAVPVADTTPVPFKELRNVQFRLSNHNNTITNDSTRKRSGSFSEIVASSSVNPGEVDLLSINNNNASSSSSSCLRPSEGSLVVAAACGSAHTVVLVKNGNNGQNNFETADCWNPAPLTYLFGCGRREAIGDFTLPPDAGNTDDNNHQQQQQPTGRSVVANTASLLLSARSVTSSSSVNNNNNNNTSKKTPLQIFMEQNSPRRAVPPDQNTFRHLSIGDGEDFDALWAYGDLTFARGRRGLLCFGTITATGSNNNNNGGGSSEDYNGSSNKSRSSSSQQQQLKYHSPTQPQVVIPAPLGCFVKEVIVLNSVGKHPRTIYAFLDQPQEQNNDSESNNTTSYNTKRTLFDATRLLEIHIAFPAGPGGDLKMLNPPPPIFSYADVTEKIFGSVATNLRRMGAPLFRLKKLACGSEHAVGVTVDGAVVGFGSNYFGQLGETANGSDQGPRFADESHVGPRTARMYPSVDCSSVSSKLHRQYYESAVLLKPPSLKRSPLVIAQAYAQYKGRTVEFNDVVKVVPIPDRIAIQQARGDHNSSVNSDDSNNNNNNNYDDDDYYDQDDEDEDSYYDNEDNSGSNNKSKNNNNKSKKITENKNTTNMMRRKSTGAPSKMSIAASASRKALLAQLNAREQQETNDENENNINNLKKVALNPAWPQDTVVDCCCGPLFTAFMQSNAELYFVGDHAPVHLQQQQEKDQMDQQGASSLDEMNAKHQHENEMMTDEEGGNILRNSGSDILSY